MKSKFRKFPCWLWARNALYWHQNIWIEFPIKRPTKYQPLMSVSHSLCKLVTWSQKSQTQNIKNKLETFWKCISCHIEKLMDMSKNKNMTKETTTWINVCHTWVKYKEKITWSRKVEPKKIWRTFTRLFYGTEKTSWARL